MISVWSPWVANSTLYEHQRGAAVEGIVSWWPCWILRGLVVVFLTPRLHTACPAFKVFHGFLGTFFGFDSTEKPWTPRVQKPVQPFTNSGCTLRGKFLNLLCLSFSPCHGGWWQYLCRSGTSDTQSAGQLWYLVALSRSPQRESHDVASCMVCFERWDDFIFFLWLEIFFSS